MRIFVRLLLLHLCILGIIKFVIPQQTKIDLRFALFSKIIHSQEEFEKEYSAVTKYNFKESVHLKKFKYRYCVKDSLIPIYSTNNEVERVKKIALFYSMNGGYRCNDSVQSLLGNIHWLKHNRTNGCCSDFSQAFMTISQLNGLTVREVHHKLHTFNEFWSNKLNKWIWVDTQYCLLATDEDGMLLNTLEIKNNFKAGKKVNWKFFGNKEHILYTKDPCLYSKGYFTKAPFFVIIITNAYDMYRAEMHLSKVNFIPKEVIQFAYILLDILPDYTIYDPLYKITYHMLLIKFLVILLVIVYLYIIYKICV